MLALSAISRMNLLKHHKLELADDERIMVISAVCGANQPKKMLKEAGLELFIHFQYYTFGPVR